MANLLVTISTDTAITVIENLEHRNADLVRANDARWDEIRKLSDEVRTLTDQLSDLKWDHSREISRLNGELEGARALARTVNPEGVELAELRNHDIRTLKIPVIKQLREHLGIGLKEAKMLADKVYDGLGYVNSWLHTTPTPAEVPSDEEDDTNPFLSEDGDPINRE
jgi:hypothetical protein